MIIQVEHLNYEYTDKRALEDVSFQIGEGAITALVGPNGAGKTTLLRCLAALSKPISGEIRINGYNALTEPRMVHRQVGYLSDFFGLYDQLSVRQSLQFIAHSRLEDSTGVDEAVETAIERTGVGSFVDKKISALSRGMRQRVGIAQAIIHQPKVLLLDEPASGLDPEARHSLSTLLMQLRDKGMVIIVSSHILAELEDYSTEMLVIQEGRMIEHRMLQAVLSQLRSMQLRFATEPGSFADTISRWEGVSEVAVSGRDLQLKLDESCLPRRELLKKLVMNELPVEEVCELKLNLQDEYIKTVKHHKSTQSR